jgi:hypothetical protein
MKVLCDLDPQNVFEMPGLKLLFQKNFLSTYLSGMGVFMFTFAYSPDCMSRRLVF